MFPIDGFIFLLSVRLNAARVSSQSAARLQTFFALMRPRYFLLTALRTVRHHQDGEVALAATVPSPTHLERLGGGVSQSVCATRASVPQIDYCLLRNSLLGPRHCAVWLASRE